MTHKAQAAPPDKPEGVETPLRHEYFDERVGDFASTEEAVLLLQIFSVAAWALCLDLPASIRRLPN
jgi:hypothetical protein